MTKCKFLLAVCVASAALVASNASAAAPRSRHVTAPTPNPASSPHDSPEHSSKNPNAEDVFVYVKCKHTSQESTFWAVLGSTLKLGRNSYYEWVNEGSFWQKNTSKEANYSVDDNFYKFETKDFVWIIYRSSGEMVAYKPGEPMQRGSCQKIDPPVEKKAIF